MRVWVREVENYGGRPIRTKFKMLFIFRFFLFWTLNLFWSVLEVGIGYRCLGLEGWGRGSNSIV